jgi:hypothetical protein
MQIIDTTTTNNSINKVQINSNDFNWISEYIYIRIAIILNRLDLYN